VVVKSVKRELVIQAPVEKIDRVMNDASRWPEWYAGITSSEPDELFPLPGGKVQVVYEMMGMDFEIEFTQLAYEFAVSSQLEMKGILDGVSNVELHPRDGEGLLSFDFRYDIRSLRIGRILERMVRKKTEKNLEASLAALKALVESE
jgi:carbon monoxide dehydrogenase subunit G